MIRTSKTLV